MKKITLLYCLSFLLFKTQAQTLLGLETQLASLAEIMVQDTFAPNRIVASEKFNPLLISTLQQKDAFKYTFSALKNISIRSATDSTFRIFTWQVVKDANNYDYFGVIQMKGKKPKVVILKNKYTEIEDKEFADCSPDNWCGGLIYNIVQYQGKGGKQYLVFGYNLNSLYERVKYVETWKLRDGKFTFGAPVFDQKDKETRKRLVFQYSAETKSRVNYDADLQLIIFDHLTASQNELTGLTMVPDGTHEGYKLEKGTWKHIDKVFTKTSETALFPAPILDKRKGRDIYGKRKRKK